MCVLQRVYRHVEKAGAILLLSISVASSSQALVQEGTSSFDELLEVIYNRQEEHVEYEDLQDWLWACYNQPLSINQASKEDLRLLHILTDDQLDQFFMHLVRNGPLISIHELQVIPGFDLATIRLLAPFVRVVPVPEGSHSRLTGQKALKTKEGYVLVRHERTLERRLGYQYNNKQGRIPYAGSPDKLLARLIVRHPKGWTLGVAGSKVAGEALAWDRAIQYYLLPNWRFHWMLKDKKTTKTLILGDYAIGFGQGLILNAGFSMNKHSETVKVIRTNNLGIRPHTSLTTIAFSGVAVTWQWQSTALTTYYSNVNLNSHVQQGRYVHSLTRDGYYRTQKELAKRKRIKEQVIGGTLVYRDPTMRTELGLSTLYSHYSLPVYAKPSSKKYYGLSGRHHANGSIFYRHLWQNLHFFGEGALSLRGKAAITGVVAGLSRYVDATLLLRHYDRYFYSPYGNAFRENATSNSNEQGIYVGIKLQPRRRLYLNSYCDYFHLSVNSGEPHPGYSWLAKVTYHITKHSNVFLQCKHITKTHQRAKHKQAAVSTQQRWKVFGQYVLSKTITGKSEVQCSRHQQSGTPSWGYAVVQECIYRRHKLRLKGRIAWFNAKKSYNRLYAYEANILYTGFNFRAYHGKGTRYCLLACYRPTPLTRIELKYALTHYRDRAKISSGQATIQGNTQNELCLQIIFKL